MKNITSLVSLQNLHPYSYVTINYPIVPFLYSLSFILFLSIRFFTFPKLKDDKSIQLPLPPGPKPWPIIGCLPIMLKNKHVFRWIHSLMKELNTEIACIRLGNVHVIVVTCPNISCQFLKAQDSVFASRPSSMSTRIFSNGYLSTVLVPFGEQWKKMKRVLLLELISPEKHKFFYSKRLEEANHLVQYVHNLCTKPELGGLVNVRFVSRHHGGNLTRNIVFDKRSFGNGNNDFGGPSFEDKEHVDAVFTLLAYVYPFCVSDFLPFLKGFDFCSLEKAIKEAKKIMKKYQDSIIEQRFQQWSIGNKKQVEDLFDMFITLKDANGNHVLSKEEIQAQITELMMAIVDNPSNVVEWALTEMLNKPKIMAKAIEELDRVVGKERLVEESDLPKLNYITTCIRETFRLHPIAPFNLPHVAMANTTVGNYFIPKGSHILLSRVGLGRNPKIWDEPEKFEPERHLRGCDKVSLVESDLRFISFSTVKRGCPGVRMGTSMTLTLFARLLQGFNWNIPYNQTRIDLSESLNSLALAKPLVALATPCLAAHVYFP